MLALTYIVVSCAALQLKYNESSIVNNNIVKKGAAFPFSQIDLFNSHTQANNDDLYTTLVRRLNKTLSFFLPEILIKLIQTVGMILQQCILSILSINAISLLLRALVSFLAVLSGYWVNAKKSLDKINQPLKKLSNIQSGLPKWLQLIIGYYTKQLFSAVMPILSDILIVLVAMLPFLPGILSSYLQQRKKAILTRRVEQLVSGNLNLDMLKSVQELTQPINDQHQINASDMQKTFELLNNKDVGDLLQNPKFMETMAKINEDLKLNNTNNELVNINGQKPKSDE